MGASPNGFVFVAYLRGNRFYLHHSMTTDVLTALTFVYDLAVAGVPCFVLYNNDDPFMSHSDARDIIFNLNSL